MLTLKLVSMLVSMNNFSGDNCQWVEQAEWDRCGLVGRKPRNKNIALKKIEVSGLALRTGG